MKKSLTVQCDALTRVTSSSLTYLFEYFILSCRNYYSSIKRCDFISGDVSLGVGSEVSKVHTIPYKLSLPRNCVLS